MAEKPIKQKIASDKDTASVDYKELVDFLAVKFDEVNDKLDQKADKSELAAVRADVDAVSSKVNTVLDRVIRMSDKLDDYHAEQIGLKHQVDKHEKWHFKTAAKVGIKLLED
jgi:vacuolar-type H+-ATPase subunit I/STV1